MSEKNLILEEDQRKYSFLSNSIAQRVSPKLVGRLLSIYEVVVHFIRLNLCRIVLFIGFFLLLELVLLSDGVTQFLNENDLANYEKNNPKSSVSMSVNESLTTKISTSSATIPTAKLDLCNCNGENFCFTGLDEVGNVRLGLPFNCSLYEKLKSLQLLDSDAANAKPDYKQIVADDNWSPVFVTSVSISHFRELRNFVRTIRTHYPKSKIVIFDVGLQRKEIQELKSWCLVEYRRFEFSKYPPHVKKIMNYSFKLAIIEAFQTYKTFFYLDTSVRIKSKNLATFLQGVQSGVLLPFIVSMQLFIQAYWNIANLAYLFGPKRGAVKLHYCDDWEILNENLIAEVEKKRGEAMQKFFSLIDVNRDNFMKTKLELKCQ